MDSLAQGSSDNLLEMIYFFDELEHVIFAREGGRVGRKRTLSLSEVATIAILKTPYAISQLKLMYKLITDRTSRDFRLPFYKNFVVTMNITTPELLFLIQVALAFKNKTAGAIKIIDSTAIPVCKNIRIPSHRVMKRLATRSKTTTGWFYGLKLHVVTDDK